MQIHSLPNRFEKKDKIYTVRLKFRWKCKQSGVANTYWKYASVRPPLPEAKAYYTARVIQVSCYWCKYRQRVCSRKLRVQENVQIYVVVWFMAKVTLNRSGYESIISIMCWVNWICTQKNILTLSHDINQHNFHMGCKSVCQRQNNSLPKQSKKKKISGKYLHKLQADKNLSNETKIA